jgi:hypothetical protein
LTVPRSAAFLSEGWKNMNALQNPTCVWSVLLLIAAVSARPAWSGDGSGPQLVRVPDPLSGANPAPPLAPLTVPEPARPFPDACFGTRLMRVTRQPGLRHEYARFDPLNRGQSMILLLWPPAGEFRVYRTGGVPYDAPGNFVRTVDLEEPRWDPNDANVIWGLRDFHIVTLEVTTGKTTVVKNFARDPVIGPLTKTEPDLYRVTTKGEGESSSDKRYWALLLQGAKDDHRLRYVFCWDRQLDRVLGVHRIALEDRNVDWVGMSPLGTWVIIGSEFDNTGKLIGPQLADRALTRFHRIDYSGGHADVGLDSRGREVIVMQNSRTDFVDLLPLDEKTLPILEAGGSYAGTKRTPLVRLHYASDSSDGFESGVHISCNAPGWAVISTYTAPDAKARNWLDRKIILVRLDTDKPAAYYLAQVHNTTASYWEETQATITNDGAKVVWAANWGREVGKERCWVMQAEVPSGFRPAPRHAAGHGPRG